MTRFRSQPIALVVASLIALSAGGSLAHAAAEPDARLSCPVVDEFGDCVSDPGACIAINMAGACTDQQVLQAPSGDVDHSNNG